MFARRRLAGLTTPNHTQPSMATTEDPPCGAIPKHNDNRAAQLFARPSVLRAKREAAVTW